MSSKRSADESLIIFGILAAAGGFLDAYTYILRGGVFANAQTGNLVMLGVGLARGDANAPKYLFPITAFIIGIIVSRIVQSKSRTRKYADWRVIVLLSEVVIAVGIGFVKCGCGFDKAVTTSVSFITAMQYSAFRAIDGRPFATTMCTGMLRSGTDNLYRLIAERDKTFLRPCIQYFSVIAVFVAGCAAGAVSTEAFSERSIWIVAAVILFATIMYIFKRAEAEGVR